MFKGLAMNLPANLIIYFEVSIIALGGAGYVYYKIDKAGFDRCDDGYKLASQKQKDASRIGIIKTEKEHAKINKAISRVEGDKNIPAPRVDIAIDSMRPPQDADGE